MDFGFTLNRREDDITAGIGTNIIKLITKAVESNSTESFYMIDGFCNRILMMSIENKHLYHFKEYLSIVVGYYIISYEYNNKNEALYSKICQACADRSARRIRELFILLNVIFKKSDLAEKKVYNQFKLLSFNAFSQLLFEQIKRKDLGWFKYTLNQIENVFLGETIGMSEFVMTLRDSQNIDKTQLDNYIEDVQVNIYARHTILGIRYWLYYLYENKQISFKEITPFITLTEQFKRTSLSADFWEMELLFNKLNSSDLFGYFNWQSWDYETRPEGEFYTMPSVLDWFFIGYIVDTLRYGGICNVPNFDVNVIDGDINLQKKTLLIRTLKERLEKVISEKKVWSPFFNNNFDSAAGLIKKQLNSFSSFIELQKAKEIASEKLDTNRVNEFKQSLYDRWNKSKLIRKIFEHFKEKRKYEGEIGKLKLVGQNMFFENAKILFLNDKHYQHIYGVEDLGTQLSKWENEFFFQIILKEQTEIVYSSIIVCGSTARY